MRALLAAATLALAPGCLNTSAQWQEVHDATVELRERLADHRYSIEEVKESAAELAEEVSEIPAAMEADRQATEEAVKSTVTAGEAALGGGGLLATALWAARAAFTHARRRQESALRARDERKLFGGDPLEQRIANLEQGVGQ